MLLEKGVTMNGLRYLEMLHDNLAECFDICKADLFQQDGASCHTSQSVKELFDDYAINYIQDWLANGPDCNPVENIWSVIKKELRKRDRFPFQTERILNQSVGGGKCWHPVSITHGIIKHLCRALADMLHLMQLA